MKKRKGEDIVNVRVEEGGARKRSSWEEEKYIIACNYEEQRKE